MSARKNRGKKGNGRNRQEALPNYWQILADEARFGEEVFRVTCVRGERKNPDERVVSLNPFSTSVSWDDSGPILRGSLAVQRTRGRKPLAINEGHIVRLECAPRLGGRYRLLWTMRITESSVSAQGTAEYTLADEMEWLQKSRDDWQFKKSKGKGDNRTKKPKGFLAHEVAREVARRYGLKVGRLAKGTKRINNLTEKNASPLDVIMKAYKIERQHTGRKFVVRIRNGRLEVIVPRRSKHLLALGGTLMEASLQRSLKEDFATATTARATIKDGGKQKKVSVDVVATNARKRYGYVRRPIRLEDPVHSKAEARKVARRELAETMEPNREVSIEHPGVSTLRRGDCVRVRLPELGFRELVYVKGVQHSVASGSYSMNVTCRFTDPYEDKEGQEIRKKRCQKAREKGRKLPGFCSDSETQKRPRPKNAKRRDEAKAGKR